MSNSQAIYVPDIGSVAEVDVIEVLVSPGDTVQAEDSLMTLEGDKATMDIPAPMAGVVEAVHVKAGDKVSEGSLIVTLQAKEGQAATGKEAAPIGAASDRPSEVSVTTVQKRDAVEARKTTTSSFVPEHVKLQHSAALGSPGITIPAMPSFAGVHAGPAVRRLAREFGVDLTRIKGNGEKARITKSDVQAFVKHALSCQPVPSVAQGLVIAPALSIDFSKFGEIESKPLSKIKKLTGVNVHRNWVTIPHVTQFAEADITEMEAFRIDNKDKAAKMGFKLTPLVFIMKAVVASLKAFPQFNSSLDEVNDAIIYKKYYHLGVAADTPNGLVVPVIRDVDQKNIQTLANELGEISQKAREKGLTGKEMAGSCFTISSLGGIGGTAFTPIVKAPDVAILGLSKSSMQPVYQDGHFVPRLMLPLSLSYDHRVIDGAEAARFIVHLSNELASDRYLTL